MYSQFTDAIRLGSGWLLLQDRDCDDKFSRNDMDPALVERRNHQSHSGKRVDLVGEW